MKHWRKTRQFLMLFSMNIYKETPMLSVSVLVDVVFLYIGATTIVNEREREKQRPTATEQWQRYLLTYQGWAWRRVVHNNVRSQSAQQGSQLLASQGIKPRKKQTVPL
ncbi:hypothetical protein ILYODFUR_021813 [Ilyodon furcidens]|uniref:Uncharacterized protein n=1 Tax=Ilyodon furcidens TaxID=33524 RepID=A0ABV0SRP7_9TELE